MNSAAFLQGYLYKDASLGSARSFSASVGNATKKFLNGNSGSSVPSDISRDNNLPKSKFKPKYENIQDIILKSGLKHPVKPNTEEAIDRVKETP